MKLTRLILCLGALLLFANPVLAYDKDNQPDDDLIVFDLTKETWVTTKTANVTISVEAAVTEKSSSKMRTNMQKAVESLAEGDWRMTNFYRREDNTGMEHWSARYQARVPEKTLAGLHEKARKKSSAGMRISVKNVDFTPTLEEKEEARLQTRLALYKEANKQLALFNKETKDRKYRIVTVGYTSSRYARPRLMSKSLRRETDSLSASVANSNLPEAEIAEKIIMKAEVVFGTRPAK